MIVRYSPFGPRVPAKVTGEPGFPDRVKVTCSRYVEADVLLRETAHELGVGEAVLAGGGVDALDPQGAEFALLSFSVTVSVGETFFVGVLRNRPNVLPGQEVAASLGKDLLAACP